MQKRWRILIVEDEFLIAMFLEELLKDGGHQVVASAAQVEQAAGIAARADLDFAVLDINLSGASSFPVAEILRRRGIPFVFTTGYGLISVPDEFKDAVMLEKPYEPRELVRIMARMVS